jgi:hypothetical protein
MAFSFLKALADNLIPQSHLEMVNLRLCQLRNTSPKHCLLKRLNQNCPSDIVPRNVKSLSEVTNKFPLPWNVIPHVYEGERRDVHQLIHKTSPIPSPITPVSQHYSFLQFN